MYQFYLGSTLLPVAPSEFKIKIKNQNTTLKLLNEGELNILKSPGLTEFSFQVLLPNSQYSFAEYADSFQPAVYFTSFLEKLKTTRSVFDFTVIRILGTANLLDWNTSIKATLESYTLSESSKEGTDIIADITLKQYISYGTKVLTIKDNTATSEPSRDTSSKPSGKTYTIKDDDTLWGIAQTQLGDGTRWIDVYKANKKILDEVAESRGCPAESGDRWIFTGTEITIPS